MKIKFSIIIAVFNNSRLIGSVIESIIGQTYSHYELIVIDGGSTDGTVEVLKKYNDHISYWTSEKDEGIYSAWNKGIAEAKGDWVMFLGSDDKLLPNALHSYQTFVGKNEDTENLEYISSRVLMQDNSGNPIRIKGWPWNWPLLLKDMLVAHPGSLHSFRLFEKYGRFDSSFKIAGDYELLLRARSNLKAAYMDEITVIMSEGGVSDSISAIKEQYIAAIKSGGANKFVAFVNMIHIIIKFSIKKLIRTGGFNIYLKK